MHIEAYRNYCLSKNSVTEAFPFDNNTLVFKVAGKMFALADVDLFTSINLKCDPEKAVQLREEYDGCILPGYHMNKKHWNTILMDGTVGDNLIKDLIHHSYELIVAGLSKKLRDQMTN